MLTAAAPCLSKSFRWLTRALTAETFAQIDVDANGEADMEEVAAAQEAGLLVNNG